MLSKQTETKTRFTAMYFLFAAYYSQFYSAKGCEKKFIPKFTILVFKKLLQKVYFKNIF